MRLRSCLHRLVNEICKQALKNFLSKWQFCIIRYFYKTTTWFISFPASLRTIFFKSVLWSFAPSFDAVIQNIYDIPQLPSFRIIKFMLQCFPVNHKCTHIIFRTIIKPLLNLSHFGILRHEFLLHYFQVFFHIL